MTMYRTPAPAGPSTTARGLGWHHQRERARLLTLHVDGTPCPCLELDDCGPACPCRRLGVGVPMYRDPARNLDGRALQADHPLARSLGGRVASRLLLATCNASRGNGTRGRRRLLAPAARRTPAPRPFTGERLASVATSRDWFAD